MMYIPNRVHVCSLCGIEILYNEEYIGKETLLGDGTVVGRYSHVACLTPQGWGSSALSGSMPIGIGQPWKSQTWTSNKSNGNPPWINSTGGLGGSGAAYGALGQSPGSIIHTNNLANFAASAVMKYPVDYVRPCDYSSITQPKSNVKRAWSRLRRAIISTGGTNGERHQKSETEG